MSTKADIYICISYLDHENTYNSTGLQHDISKLMQIGSLSLNLSLISCITFNFSVLESDVFAWVYKITWQPIALSLLGTKIHYMPQKNGKLW
jgi:hypothetical protein